MSAQVAITQLPAAGTITGTEAVPIVQNGVTVQTTTGAISASPSQTQTFLTKNLETTLPNSRYLSSNTGIGITDGGAQGPLTIALNGVSASLESASNGIIAKSGGAVIARTLATSGAGLGVTNGSGVSGNPTFQLTGVAASIANLSGTGMLALTGGGTSVSGRTLIGVTNQIAVTNGDGSAGSPTFAIATNPALPGAGGVGIPSGTTAERPASPSSGTFRYNSTTGLLEYYSAGTWTSLAAGSGVTSIATGTGLTGGPITSTGTISIANTAVTAGTYGTDSRSVTFVVNAQGQLTSVFDQPIAISNSQVTGLGTMSTQNASAVAITGGTINATSVGATTPSTGAFTSVSMTSGTITTAPTNGTDIVNKDYADTIAAGLNYHQPVNYASTTTLPAYTYNNGASGVGATITAVANGALSLGGGSPTATQRVLIKNEISANAPYNGVYVVTQAGTTLLPFILTRASDYDTSGTGTNEIDQGDYVLVISGTLASTAWVQQTALPITVGTTALSFVQFNAPITYSAGTGLTLASTTFSITDTAVTSGSYGGAATVPTFFVNAQGQLTAATNVSIAIAASQVISGTLAVAQGGTNLASYATGDLVYASGTTTLAKLPIGSANYVLTSSGTTPQYVAQSTLSVGSATNVAGGAASQLHYQTGVGTTGFIANGTAGQVLTSAGSSTPVWSGISGGTF